MIWRTTYRSIIDFSPSTKWLKPWNDKLWHKSLKNFLQNVWWKVTFFLSIIFSISNERRFLLCGRLSSYMIGLTTKNTIRSRLADSFVSGRMSCAQSLLEYVVLSFDTSHHYSVFFCQVRIQNTLTTHALNILGISPIVKSNWSNNLRIRDLLEKVSIQFWKFFFEILSSHH